MKTVQLSNSDLVVSRLCFGCWGIISDFHWGQRDEAQAVATISAALDAGVNFFDTAAMYGNGASETLLGRLLAGRRDRVIVALQRAGTRHGEPGCEAETFAALNAIRNLCRRLGRTMADVALAWCNQQPGISSVIAGASTPEQLRQNVSSIENPLPDDAAGELDRATEQLKLALGPNPDMWQGRDQSRFR